ncbi:hypothetical protein GIB67_029652 [Kingdonia uniflora]|uniref:Uncharacterized protein n=1 Tax=Kingdonia uniflora TaxID=39325 RepID=A0A7J7LLJ5_9MAGN|nr:hypothetical protein GIB67_029652 [Kingdonia uniflora]
MYDDLKSALQEKELKLRNLSSSSDEYRASCGVKLKTLEGQNRELISALDETNMRARDHEKKIYAYKEDTECLKRHLSALQKKCFEAEERAQASKELIQRDGLLMKLEEDYHKLENTLKWKNEQFKHLEDAHEKLQNQFQESKNQWEVEKSMLVDEIFSLQTSLDSKTRSLESLELRLQMCNQALAHEESRRKLLEVQISETKACYENVFTEYEEAKSKIESLMIRSNEDIAVLRNSLGKKDALLKESEYSRGQLDQENHELRDSLKELREIQIKEAGATSSIKLRNKLKGLEQVHRDCFTNDKARDAQWSSQIAKMIVDLNDCRSGLGSRHKQIQNLETELELYHSSTIQLKLETEEMFVMLLVFKSGFSEAQSKLSNPKAGIELCDKENEVQISFLSEELRKKESALIMARNDIKQQRETLASLERKLHSFDLIENQRSSMQKELDRYKEMAVESSECLRRLRERVSQKENTLNEELGKVCDSLEKTNSELSEKTRVEKENDKTVKDLQQKIVLLEEDLRKRETETNNTINLVIMETMKDVEHERKSFLRTLEEMEETVDSLEQEYIRNEIENAVFAHIKVEKIFEREKVKKCQIIEDLQERIISLEQYQNIVLLNFKEKATEVNRLSEAWEKVSTARILAEVEIQEKNVVIDYLEEEVKSSHQKLEMQYGAAIEAKQLEMMKAMDQLGSRLITSECVNKKLESENGVLLEEVRKLSSEKEELLAHILGYNEKLNRFSNEDAELMEMVSGIVQRFDKENDPVTDFKEGKHLFRSSRDDLKSSASIVKLVEENHGERSPLKDAIYWTILHEAEHQ